MSQEYENNIHYNTYKLGFDTKKEILEYAKELCYEWWADELVGLKRQKWNVPFSTIIGKMTPSSHFSFIHRKGYKDWEQYGEIGFSTSGGDIVFLWIKVKEGDIDKITKKFDLKRMP